MLTYFKRKCRLQRVRILIVWCSISLTGYMVFKYSHAVSKRGVHPPCLLPQMEINNAAINSFFNLLPPLECSSEPDWVCVGNGHADFCNPSQYPSILCNYSFFERSTDNENIIKTNIVNWNGSLELVTDFFSVACQSDNDGLKSSWNNVMAGVKPSKTIQTNSKFDHLPSNALKLNVLMYGYDSLSRLTFMRKLPETYKYLTEELGAIVLEGYNIVGDGTPQALIPILTGQTETELPETRKRKENAHFVDVYPFVWNDFKRHEYVTAYVEDCPSIGTFTYRLKGFGAQPTDHYMRPFYIEVDNVKFDHKSFCLGARPRHKVMMDYIEDFFDSYKDNPKFFFGFHGELSHDDLNLIGLADNDTMNMMRHLREKGHLENTMLIVMSDHGHRFASIRDTQQGKQEERLPFFSISLPSWFKRKHPAAWNNLVTNSKRLTSPFDIHPTLKSILNYNETSVISTKSRSISLFHEVPEHRTCEDAGIETHWCACLTWISEPTNSHLVQTAAKTLVDHINNLTHSHRMMCESLKLSVIERAEKYLPHADLLKFKKNADLDGFVGDFSDSTAISLIVYQIKIITNPGSGHFEATLTYDTNKRTFKARTDMISRTNMYGNDPICIMDQQQDLRKYCYCKKDKVEEVQ